MASPTENTDRAARRAQMLAELAELTFSAAQHAHGRLLAAETSAEVAETSLAFHRVARALRQTLLLETRFEKDAQAPVQAPVDRSAATGDPRKARVRAEVVREIAEQAEDADAAEELIDDVDLVFDAMVEGHDFEGRGEEALIADLCRFVRLERRLAPAGPANDAEPPEPPKIVSVNGWPPEPDSS